MKIPIIYKDKFNKENDHDDNYHTPAYDPFSQTARTAVEDPLQENAWLKKVVHPPANKKVKCLIQS